jgi:hypothetical protein
MNPNSNKNKIKHKYLSQAKFGEKKATGDLSYPAGGIRIADLAALLKKPLSPMKHGVF